MKKLSKNQRQSLSEFCANFAVAWLAAGIIAPYVTGRGLGEVIKPAVMSVIWAGFLLTVMVFLAKGEKK